jgi:phage replication-related protein YjqB (UPF0714/DUF867 family)
VSSRHQLIGECFGSHFQESLDCVHYSTYKRQRQALAEVLSKHVGSAVVSLVNALSDSFSQTLVQECTQSNTNKHHLTFLELVDQLIHATRFTRWDITFVLVLITFYDKMEALR